MKYILIIFLLFSSFVQAQYTEILQASAMPYRTSGSAFGFNNDYYQFLSNGFVSDSVYFPDTAFYQFDIGAWSNYSRKQWGNLQIKVDGSVVSNLYINQKIQSFFTAKTFITAGFHRVSIGLTNHTSLVNVKLKLGLIYISKVLPIGLIHTAVDSGFLTIDKWTSGHLRGFNEGTESIWHPTTENNYRDLAATGANLIRHHFTIILDQANDVYRLEDGDFQRFDSIVSWASKYGYYVNIGFDQDPHSSDQLWWGSKKREQSIVDLWKQVAFRYKDSKFIAAYSPLNEPTPAGRVAEYLSWMLQIADTIKTVDTNHCIVFPWAHDFNILDMMLPLPYTNVIYEYHAYDPFEITSQGINGFTQSKTYPSAAYTKADLSLKLDKLRAFRARWNVPVYIGEFGCVRYAPRNAAGESSSDRWYLDAISLFEAEDWPWTTQSWRQSEIWDPEISSWLFYKCSYQYAEPTCNFGVFDQYRSDTTKVMTELKNQFLKNGF